MGLLTDSRLLACLCHFAGSLCCGFNIPHWFPFKYTGVCLVFFKSGGTKYHFVVFVEFRLPALVLLNNLQVLLLDSGWIIILGKVLAAESCWNLCILFCLAISSGDCKDIHGLPCYGSLSHMHTIPPPKKNSRFLFLWPNRAALNAESPTLYCCTVTWR